jgi:hypothetical protein
MATGELFRRPENSLASENRDRNLYVHRSLRMINLPVNQFRNEPTNLRCRFNLSELREFRTTHQRFQPPHSLQLFPLNKLHNHIHKEPEISFLEQQTLRPLQAAPISLNQRPTVTRLNPVFIIAFTLTALFSNRIAS